MGLSAGSDLRPTIENARSIHFVGICGTAMASVAAALKERGIAEVVLAGLATDFCVGFSALDAVTCGFKTSVVMQACRAIDLDGSLAAMTDKMRAAGVHLL